MNLSAPGLRDRRLRALGVMPLRWRGSAGDGAAPSTAADTALPPGASAVPARGGKAPAGPAGGPPAAIRRLALQPDEGLGDPSVRHMYTALTDAVGKAGLQPVRACDVAGDPTAAVLVFGAATVPAGVPEARVLRADPLAVLHADRTRKRLLWERMQALGRGGA